MKKTFAVLLGLVVFAIAAVAQDNQTSFAGEKWAYTYAYGYHPAAPPLQVISGSTSTGTYSITLATGYSTLGDGTAIYPFAYGVIPSISIGSGASFETVTPTSASCTTPTSYGTCTLTATFTFAHGNGDQVRSGSFGLQEALNAAFASGGGLVGIDTLWAGLGGTNSTITSATPYASVAIVDRRLGAVQYWNPTQASATILAIPTTLTGTTVASNLGVAAGVVGTWTAGTVHACVAYVDALGNEGPCSADFSFTSVVNQAIGFTAPAASTGAVGYIPYLSLVGGTYAASYRVPITSSICTLTKVETVIAACALTNTTYGQTGSGAVVAAPTVNTARIWIGKGATSTTSDYVGNSNARTSYLYAPSNKVGLPGVVPASLPFTGATAPATTVPAVLADIQLPAGFMNFVGRTIQICGNMTEASAGSTSTITTIQFLWDADGSNVAGVPVSLGGPTITATMVTANADQLSFCQNFKTTVSGAGVTAGSIQAGYGYLTESYGAATTVSAAAGPTIGAAAVGSLNLAGEARIKVVYLHTTGTDGATPILQDLTVTVLN